MLPPNTLDHISPWVARFAALIPPGEVLDLACGNGRHARLLAQQGHTVLALDRDAQALEHAVGAGIRTLQFDLERDAPWPFASDRFAGVVVTHYLHRPLLPHLFESLAPGGVLIYETFADGNQRFGKPSRPDFLLQPGELLDVVRQRGQPDLHVLAFEDGYVAQPRPAQIQRICVVRAMPEAEPTAHRLD